MVYLVTCKNKEDSIKNEGAKVFTTLYINFSNAQGQTTPESVVVSGRNLNTSMRPSFENWPSCGNQPILGNRPSYESYIYIIVSTIDKTITSLGIIV